MLDRVYPIITNKDDLTKENTRIKQELKENVYQESIIIKHFRKLLATTDIQEGKIRMGINLPYVQGTSEKLRGILKSQKIISTLYTESTLHKLLWKPNDRVATKDKINIAYEAISLTVVTACKSTLVNLNGL